MANTKSAKKMVRKIEKRTLINRMRRSMVRTSVKKAEALIESGDKDDAKIALVAAERQLMRGAQKGAFNKKTASRKISRLNKKLINA
jgi:small subunit ribosomal protein S20